MICGFREDLDAYDKPSTEPFEGLHIDLIGIQENEVNISFEKLYGYMKLVMERYVSSHPEEKAELEASIGKFRKRFLEGE